MKIKHNKKRNTAFVYEALIREATVATLKHNKDTRDKALQIIKKHFTPDSELKRDLGCYKSLCGKQGLEKTISEKIMREAKIAQRLIDPSGLFKAQTELIDDINKELSPSVFGNFVPNYKTLATISQIFHGRLSPKKVVMLENQIVDGMTRTLEQKANEHRVDDIVLKTFVSKFNDKYTDGLLEEQRDLLSYYISSFADNSVELKMFLNEEISRLKKKVAAAKGISEFKEDNEMLAKTNKIIEKLDNFASQSINEEVLLTVMRTQELVKEIYSDGDNN
jgi:hypothetical protein